MAGGVITAAVIGGISSLFGGISSSKAAADQNAQAQRNYEEQLKAAQAAADAQNEYNQRAFEVEKQNYQNFRKYEWETAVKSWQYQSEIQDFQYLQAAKQYLGSVENTEQQLIYNSIAERQAQESEQASLNEIMVQDAFQREGMLIESLQREGQASLMQAGGSRAKAIQATVADLGRNSAILRASLISAGQQSERNMRDIELSRYADDIKAKAAMMIKPERLPDIPSPIPPPERIFVEPMAALPGFTPTPAMQSPAGALFQGISSAAATVGGMAMQAAYYGRNSSNTTTKTTTPPPQTTSLNYNSSNLASRTIG